MKFKIKDQTKKKCMIVRAEIDKIRSQIEEN